MRAEDKVMYGFLCVAALLAGLGGWAACSVVTTSMAKAHEAVRAAREDLTEYETRLRSAEASIDYVRNTAESMRSQISDLRSDVIEICISKERKR